PYCNEFRLGSVGIGSQWHTRCNSNHPWRSRRGAPRSPVVGGLRPMKPFLTLAVLIPVVLAAGVAGASPVAGDLTFVCKSVEFPDGTTGHAIVRVHEAGPIVDVEYFSEDGQSLLGWFDEAGPLMPPYDINQAWSFAVENYPLHARPD